MKYSTILACLCLLSISAKSQNLNLSNLLGIFNKDVGEINELLIPKGWHFEKRSSRDSLGYFQLKWTYKRDITITGDTIANQWLKVYSSYISTPSVSYQFSDQKLYKELYSQLVTTGLHKITSIVTKDNNIEDRFVGKYYEVYLTSLTENQDFEIEIFKK